MKAILITFLLNTNPVNNSGCKLKSFENRSMQVQDQYSDYINKNTNRNSSKINNNNNKSQG